MQDNANGWEAIEPTVISNIENNQPVLLAISGSVGAHAVVIDGYNASNGTFHIDLGWGAGEENSNGNNDWYSIPLIATDGGAFVSVETVIYNMAPPAPNGDKRFHDDGTGTYGLGR